MIAEISISVNQHWQPIPNCFACRIDSHTFRGYELPGLRFDPHVNWLLGWVAIQEFRPVYLTGRELYFGEPQPQPSPQRVPDSIGRAIRKWRRSGPCRHLDANGLPPGENAPCDAISDRHRPDRKRQAVRP
jgi:hypothetical protein